MSLFNSMSVSASGMSAQRFRTELLAQNIANSETTRTEEGGPYRHQDAVFQSAPVTHPFSSSFQSSLDESNSGVAVSEVQIDDREPIRRDKNARSPALPFTVEDRDDSGHRLFDRRDASLLCSHHTGSHIGCHQSRGKAPDQPDRQCDPRSRNRPAPALGMTMIYDSHRTLLNQKTHSTENR